MIWRTDNVVGIVGHCCDHDVLLSLLVAIRNHILIAAAVVLIKELRMKNVAIIIQLQRIQRVQVGVFGEIRRNVPIHSRVIVLIIIELPISDMVVRFV